VNRGDRYAVALVNAVQMLGAGGAISTTSQPVRSMRAPSKLRPFTSRRTLASPFDYSLPLLDGPDRAQAFPRSNWFSARHRRDREAKGLDSWITNAAETVSAITKSKRGWQRDCRIPVLVTSSGEFPVSAAAQHVLREAMGLTPMERAELIDARLRSFDPKADDDLTNAWRAEAESRIDDGRWPQELV
jgi:hypothetical protein